MPAGLPASQLGRAFPMALEMTKISVHCLFVAEPVSGQKDALLGCWLLSNVLEKIPAHSRRCVVSSAFPLRPAPLRPACAGGRAERGSSSPKIWGQKGRRCCCAGSLLPDPEAPGFVPERWGHLPAVYHLQPVPPVAPVLWARRSPRLPPAPLLVPVPLLALG